VRYVRYESDRCDAEGRRVGIFGLANGLARSGRLTPVDWKLWRAGNDWYDAAYTDPGSVNPKLWDKAVYPVVACWFKESAAGHLLTRLPTYLDLLDRYGVGWVARTSADPGVIRYADEVQIVVTPY